MDSTRLTALLQINAANPDNQPLGQTIELHVESDGFHDPGGIGASGEDARTLSAQEVTDRLSERFGSTTALEPILSHLAALHAAVAGATDNVLDDNAANSELL